MNKKKVCIIAFGATVAVISVSLLLLINVKGNLNDSKDIMVVQTPDKNPKTLQFDISRNEQFELLLRNKDFNDTYMKKQSQEEIGEEETPEPEIAQEDTISDFTDFIRSNNDETVFNIITGKKNTDDRAYLPETEEPIDSSVVSNRHVELPVSYLNQYPELPTGCEITSLTTVLQYLGYPVSKMTMAEDYLPKCGLGEGSFWKYFLGDPTDEYSFGCYASPIVTAANSYLMEKGNQFTAYNYSGSNFETFLKEIQDGNPVILWTTCYFEKAYTTYSWDIDGETVQWIAPEHCIVISGYDLDANTVTISDPMQGIVTCDIDTIYLRYRQMCSQAVVIKANTPNDKNTTKETESTTEKTTESITEKSTESSTENTTKGVTEITTEEVTEK